MQEMHISYISYFSYLFCLALPHTINTSTHQYINTYIDTSIHQYINTSIHQYVNTSIHQYINTPIRTMFTRVQAQTISGSPVAIGRSTSSLHRWIQSRAGGHAAHVENDGASTVGPARTIQSYFTTSKRLKDATTIQSFNHFAMLKCFHSIKVVPSHGCTRCIRILTGLLISFFWCRRRCFNSTRYNTTNNRLATMKRKLCGRCNLPAR